MSKEISSAVIDTEERRQDSRALSEGQATSELEIASRRNGRSEVGQREWLGIEDNLGTRLRTVLSVCQDGCFGLVTSHCSLRAFERECAGHERSVVGGILAVYSNRTLMLWKLGWDRVKMAGRQACCPTTMKAPPLCTSGVWRKLRPRL